MEAEHTLEPAAIDDAAFLDVMGNVAATVTVVTASHEGQHYGLTVSAFSSVSRTPPLVLVCIDKGSNSLDALRASGGFTVNFLAEGTGDAAMTFASRANDKFGQVSHRSPCHDVAGPVLADHAVAYFECSIEQEIDAGDHWVFIGRVLHGEKLDERAPLVYWRRNFVPVAIDGD